MGINELEKNLLSDIQVDSRGWLRSQSLGSGNRDEDDAYPVVFSACAKLMKVLKVDDEGTTSVSAESTSPLTINSDGDGDNEICDDAQGGEVGGVQADVTLLPFVPNVIDLISSALKQVSKMTSPIPSPPESAPENKLKRKSNDSNSNDADDTDAQWEDVGKQAKRTSKQNIDEYYDDASERIQITFNTLAVLLHILLPMLHHKSQSDFDIIMKGGPSITKSGQPKKKKNRDKDNNANGKPEFDRWGKKTQAYLFFEKAYSIVTERQMKSIKKEISFVHIIVKKFFARTHRGSHPASQLYDYGDRFAIPKLFMESTSSSAAAEMVQKTLLISMDPEGQEFGNKIDKAMIHPLEGDRKDMDELHQTSIQNLHDRLTNILTGTFKHAYLEVYGSCLSGLSLGKSSDVDISLYIPQADDLYQRFQDGKIERAAFQQQLKKLVYKVHGAINGRSYWRGRSNNQNRQNNERSEFRDLEAVPYARVPVIKGRYLHANNPFSQDGSMHFDICILNDIAVANSDLLREYSILDPRVKLLMLSVKSWIKWKRIGSAAENTLSSYTWMIMCIFYLQCIGFLPTLQCPTFMKSHGPEYAHDPKNRKHTVNGLHTSYLTSDTVLKKGVWKLPDEFKTTPVSGLLTGFFLFYARYFPQETTAVSIRLGNLSLQKTVFKSSRLWRLAIEDPFETHDSYCPHDLGTPMHEIGQNKVMVALKEAAEKMENMYVDCDEIDDCIGSLQFSNNVEDSSGTVVGNDKDNDGSKRGNFASPKPKSKRIHLKKGPKSETKKNHQKNKAPKSETKKDQQNKTPKSETKKDQQNKTPKSESKKGGGRGSNNRNVRNRARKHEGSKPDS
jgi:DNA polymerase sigma